MLYLYLWTLYFILFGGYKELHNEHIHLIPISREDEPSREHITLLMPSLCVFIAVCWTAAGIECWSK